MFPLGIQKLFSKVKQCLSKETFYFLHATFSFLNSESLESLYSTDVNIYGEEKN